MFLIHPFDKNHLSLFLFDLPLFLSLFFHSLLSFCIGPYFPKVFGGATIFNFKIIHFDSKSSLTINFKNIFHKILTSMIFIDIFLLKKGHSHQKLFHIHRASKFSSLLINLYEMFDMKFLIEIEFFTKNHPFIKIHFVSLYK